MLFSAYLTLIVDEMKKGFDSLKRCEKGIIERLFLLKFLESYSYFALSQILVLFLHLLSNKRFCATVRNPACIMCKFVWNAWKMFQTLSTFVVRIWNWCLM